MKKLLVLAMSAMMVFAATAVSFAGTSPQDTPVKLTATATAIDITVSETVTFAMAADKVTADDAQNYTITNNNAVSLIKLDKLAATNVTGWTKAAFDESAFKELPMNTTQFALQGQIGSASAFDLNNDYTGADQIKHGETLTVVLNALVGPRSEALDEATQFAKLTATVSHVTAA